MARPTNDVLIITDANTCRLVVGAAWLNTQWGFYESIFDKVHSPLSGLDHLSNCMHSYDYIVVCERTKSSLDKYHSVIGDTKHMTSDKLTLAYVAPVD